jgi:hypothetical protein
MKSIIAIATVVFSSYFFYFSQKSILQNSPGYLPVKNVALNTAGTDTDNDGLTDDFETNPLAGYPELRNLNPRHADLIVYVRWRPGLAESDVRSWMQKAKIFYANLYTSNPDSRSGINIITLFGGVLPVDDATGGALLSRYFPAELKGKAHWFEFFSGGGGQTDCGVLCCNSSAGDQGNWLGFVHEMGHQLGLSHRGPDNIAPENQEHPLNPMHPSLMNYRYSYSISNSAEKVNYSYGAFSGIPLNETNISEFFEGFTEEQLAFLKAPPFNYPVKATTSPVGTVIDWNRDGIFGQSHYRCDINDFGNNTAGRFEPALKTRITTGNVCLVNGSSVFYVLYASDNTISETQAQNITNPVDHPASVSLWKHGGRNTITLPDKKVQGDISAVKDNSWMYISYPVADGVVIYQYAMVNIEGAIASNTAIRPTHSVLVRQPENMKSQLVNVRDEIYLFTWCKKKSGDPNSNKIFYRQFTNMGELKLQHVLAETSQSDIGVCWDPEGSRLCMVRTVSRNFPNRMELVRYQFSAATHEFRSPATTLMGLPADEYRTSSRPSVAFVKLNSSMPGRIYAFHQGDGNDSVIYCTRQVGDTRYHNGWQEITLEGANTMSAVSAVNFKDDVLLAFRCRGDNNNSKSRISFIWNASGIEKSNMRDYNEVDYIRNTGLKKSLENCSR